MNICFIERVIVVEEVELSMMSSRYLFCVQPFIAHRRKLLWKISSIFTTKTGTHFVVPVIRTSCQMNVLTFQYHVLAMSVIMMMAYGYQYSPVRNPLWLRLPSSLNAVVNSPTAEGLCEMTMVGHADFILNAFELLDGGLCSVDTKGTIKAWNIGSGECKTTMTGHSGGVMWVNQLADGRILSCSLDKTIKNGMKPLDCAR